MIDLSVEIAGVRLANPVLPASGTWEFSEQSEAGTPAASLGAVINKTVFRDPRPGNPPPRLWETPGGMLNAIGIPSEGIEHFLSHKLPLLSSLGPPVIASIAGGDVAEFCELAMRVSDSGGAHLLELDLSCPNLGHGNLWAEDEAVLTEVLKAVRGNSNLPVIAKLSPNVTDIARMAQVAEQAGAAALALVNTYKGMAIDVRTARPALGNVSGGLSGPAIRPLAVYAVWKVYEAVSIPLIGMGGIAGWQDAAEHLLAGASAVAVGMYNFVNPGAMKEVLAGLAGYLEAGGFASVREITGLAHRSR
jgi:dihydroorotate dehydrogenase (NAD+) catalytic subunit